MQASINFSTDPASSTLIIEGRPQPRQPHSVESRKPPASQVHGDPYPQALDSKPDFLVISCAGFSDPNLAVRITLPR